MDAYLLHNESQVHYGVQVDLIAAHFEQLSFGKATDAIQLVSARANLFLSHKEPWTMFKKVSSQSDLGKRALSCICS